MKFFKRDFCNLCNESKQSKNHFLCDHFFCDQCMWNITTRKESDYFKNLFRIQCTLCSCVLERRVKNKYEEKAAEQIIECVYCKIRYPRSFKKYHSSHCRLKSVYLPCCGRTTFNRFKFNHSCNVDFYHCIYCRHDIPELDKDHLPYCLKEYVNCEKCSRKFERKFLPFHPCTEGIKIEFEFLI